MLLSVPLSKITRRRASVRPCCVREDLAHLGDVGLLAADDEQRARLDLGLAARSGRVCADAAIELLLHLLEQRLELVEVLAFLAVGDFLGRALVGG